MEEQMRKRTMKECFSPLFLKGASELRVFENRALCPCFSSVGSI